MRRDEAIIACVRHNGKVERSSRSARWGHGDGTRVRFWPDARYFDSPQIVAADLAALMRAKAMLLPGVKFIPASKKGRIETQTWHFPQASRATSEAR